MNLQPQHPLQFLADRRVLWIFFVSTFLLGFAFQWITSNWQFQLIDTLTSPAEVRQAIAGMSAEQRWVHVWTTATVDVLYPISFGGFFAGSALCFFDRFRSYLAIPGLLVIPVDLMEGVVQMLALTDTLDLLSAKALLTPLKMALFFLGLGITVAGWGNWLRKKVRRRS